MSLTMQNMMQLATQAVAPELAEVILTFVSGIIGWLLFSKVMVRQVGCQKSLELTRQIAGVQGCTVTTKLDEVSEEDDSGTDCASMTSSSSSVELRASTAALFEHYGLFGAAPGTWSGASILCTITDEESIFLRNH